MGKCMQSAAPPSAGSPSPAERHVSDPSVGPGFAQRRGYFNCAWKLVRELCL